MYEYELKLLGNPVDLEATVDKFLKNTTVLSDRTYKFSTVYLDTADRVFQKAGYSLRYRPENPQSGHPASVELKQLTGGQDEGISKRLELTNRKGKTFLSLYFNLLANPNYPKALDKPQFDAPLPIFETVVVRREVKALVDIDGASYLVEAAYDSIEYVREGQVIGTETEVEFELKDPEAPVASIVNWFDNNIITESVTKTYDSKATRAQNQINNLVLAA